MSNKLGTSLASRLPAVLVLIWLAAFSWLLAGDRYTAFLAENLWPIVVMAIGLLALFLVGALAGSGGHGMSAPRRLLQAGVLVLPLAYIAVVVPPEGLTSFAFATRSLQLDSMIEASARSAAQAAAPAVPSPAEPQAAPAPEPTSPTPAPVAPRSTEPAPAPAPPPVVPAPVVAPPAPPVAEAIPLTTVELTQMYDQYKDQRVSTEGMVARPGKIAAGHFVVFRFTISCCVSDAMPAGLLVRFTGADALEEDQWVRTEGTLRVEPGTYGKTLIIEADKVDKIEAPANPYLNEFGNGNNW